MHQAEVKVSWAALQEKPIYILRTISAHGMLGTSKITYMMVLNNKHVQIQSNHSHDMIISGNYVFGVAKAGLVH